MELHRFGKKVGYVTLSVLAVATIAVMALLYRNIQFDKGTSAIKSQDYVQAMRTLKPLAELGDSMSQYLIGEMFAYGWGVNKDEAQAIRWFRRAGMWYSGQGDRAAEAAYYVGERYAEQKKHDEALKWYRIAADGGSRQSAEVLAKAYENGALGLKRDPEQARLWREKAKHALPLTIP